MANYSTLKAAVADVVKTNGTQAITGANLQAVLLSIINSVGGGGYIFKGVATPSTDAGTPDENVFYLGGAGTYANFGTSVTVPVGSICVFKYNGSWTKEQIKMFDGIDTAPAQGSTNLITSDAVADLQQETTGKIGVNWIQGNISGSTGKFSTGITTRVTNYTPIVCTKKAHIICSGDVRGNSVQLYKAGYSPINGGVFNDDWISYTLPTSASRTDFYVEANTTYPNVYITFLRASNSLAAITKEEVAANVQIYDTSSMLYKLVNNGSFQGIALPDTVPDTTNEEVYYLAQEAGTYTNFGSIVINNGEYCVLAYKNDTWTKIVITKEELIILGKNDTQQTLSGYIKYSTGEFVNREGSFGFVKVYNAGGVKSVKLYAGSNDANGAMIAFYSTNEISTTSYLSAYTIQSIGDPNGSGRWYYTDNIPANAKIVTVFDRFANIAESDAIVQVEYDYLVKTANELTQEVNGLDNTVYGEQLNNLYLVQGNYSEGVPVGGTMSRVRVNRMIAKTEAPFELYVPESDNGRLYQMFFYTTYGDYSTYSYYDYMAITYPNGLKVTQDLFGDNEGMAFCFCPKNNLTDNITPADFSGTKFITKNGLEDDVRKLKDAVPSISGNSNYYGRELTLKITNEAHKLNARNVCAHYFDEYPYTTYNQSMAIWNGKAFCFNDTSYSSYGFCVVIDAETGNVLGRVTDVPQVVTSPHSSHLNSAMFTDQYYLSSDEYPLLLLSRGDYASSDVSHMCMYVFRITEPTANNFVFTLIKTIYTPNNPLTIFGASWGYDAGRKMIWGHLCTQDWRWGSSNYRKFNNYWLTFAAPFGTQYVCVTSGGETAATSATITIQVGGVIRNIDVSTGDTIEEIFPYTPNLANFSSIVANQSANAFTGQYVVYSCDANGDNKVEIKYACAIQGFPAPDLTDTSDYTVQLSEYTAPSYIDKCIYQGGSFANGKLFLPIQDYTTINKQPTDFTGHVCAVVDPVSGYIESIIKTDGLENEGCAIWNGKLYVSSHNGAATGHTIGFRLMEYSFD